MKPKVSIFVLCSIERTGWLNPPLCLSLLSLQRDPRFELTVQMAADLRPVEHARNVCIVTARNTGADVCVQIDNDQTLPSNFADILHEAISTHKAVVALSYGILPPEGPRIIPGDNGQQDGRFRQAGCAGGGVLIIGSEMWRRIPRGPWFRWIFNDDEVLSRQLGEDYYFCQLVQEHGLAVWTHQAVAGHLKTVDASRWVLRLTRLENELTRQRGGTLPLDVLQPPVFVGG